MKKAECIYLIVKLFEYKTRVQRLQKVFKLVEKRSLKQAKCLSDQLDKEATAVNKSNNNHILIIKELDFLDLINMISSKINNLLGIPINPDFVISLNNRI